MRTFKDNNEEREICDWTFLLYITLFNDQSGIIKKDDSPLLEGCVDLVQRVLSGWWRAPPEAGWRCPCLHTLTWLWSSSARPALGVLTQPAAAHTDCDVLVLRREKRKNKRLYNILSKGKVQNKLNLSNGRGTWDTVSKICHLKYLT